MTLEEYIELQPKVSEEIIQALMDTHGMTREEIDSEIHEMYKDMYNLYLSWK